MGQLMTIARRVSEADIGLGTVLHIQFLGRQLRLNGLIAPGEGGRGAPDLTEIEVATLLLATLLPIPTAILPETVVKLLDAKQKPGGDDLRFLLTYLVKEVRTEPFNCPEFSLTINVDHPHVVYRAPSGREYVYGAAFPGPVTRSVRVDHRAFWWFASA